MPQPRADTGIDWGARPSSPTPLLKMPSPTTPARGMRILVTLAFPAAIALVLLRVPLSQNADGLLETVMSLQRLTLFYWGQSRFANILPALAAPIRDPVVNADAQLVARVVLGLAAPLLVCALLTARARALSVARATILSALLFLACAPPRIITEALTQTSPFGTSLTLAGLSVLAFRRAGAAPGSAGRWRIAGLALATGAFLQNVSLAIEVAPLAVGLCVLARTRAVAEWALASAVALVATIMAMKLCAPSAAPQIGGFGHSMMALRIYGSYLSGPTGRGFWVPLGLAIASNVVARREPHAWPLLAGDLVLLGTIVVSFAATGLSNWVVMNGAHPRYLVPDYLLAASLGGLALERIVHTIRASRPGQECCAGAAAALLLVFATVHLGPRAAGDDGIIGSDWRGMSDTVAASVRPRHLDGIAGAYWDVWAAVFRMGATTPTVFGFAYNGEARRRAIVRRLRAQGELRVGCIDKPGIDCVSVTRTTIDVPVRVMESGEPALMLDAGRRMTTLVVVGLRP